MWQILATAGSGGLASPSMDPELAHNNSAQFAIMLTNNIKLDACASLHYSDHQTFTTSSVHLSGALLDASLTILVTDIPQDQGAIPRAGLCETY